MGLCVGFCLRPPLSRVTVSSSILHHTRKNVQNTAQNTAKRYPKRHAKDRTARGDPDFFFVVGFPCVARDPIMVVVDVASEKA
jgi:hypothetical protein